eukprot:Polyplicarium_translucidae@DN302_c0_g1_i1.p1
MGGDGGSIPGRADVVKTRGLRFVRNLGGMGYTPNTQVRAADESYSKNQERALRWKNCALTTNPLRKPVVACRLGRIYNKEALIEVLLSKKRPDSVKHIRSLKDVVELNGMNTKCLTCAISQSDLDGPARGWVIWRCGCVFGRSLEELDARLKDLKQATPNSEGDAETKSSPAECPNCGKSYNSPTDVIELVPSEEGAERQRRQLKRRLAVPEAPKSRKMTKCSDLPVAC